MIHWRLLFVPAFLKWNTICRYVICCYMFVRFLSFSSCCLKKNNKDIVKSGGGSPCASWSWSWTLGPGVAPVAAPEAWSRCFCPEDHQEQSGNENQVKRTSRFQLTLLTVSSTFHQISDWVAGLFVLPESGRRPSERRGSDRRSRHSFSERRHISAVSAEEVCVPGLLKWFMKSIILSGASCDLQRVMSPPWIYDAFSVMWRRTEEEEEEEEELVWKAVGRRWLIRRSEPQGKIKAKEKERK